MANFTGLQIAAEIVRRMSGRGKLTPTNLELQKLIYFCHGWHLGLLGAPLINEQFEAWRFGPVVPSVYHKFKVFSSNRIPTEHPIIVFSEPIDPNSESSTLIDRVLDVYGNFSGYELVNLSHQPGGPWDKVWDGGYFDEIDNESIKEYFTTLAHQ